MNAFMQQDEEEVYSTLLNGLPKCKMVRLQMSILLGAQPYNRYCLRPLVHQGMVVIHSN